jgi:NADH-quinone oxidoreductase subunit E
MPTIAEAAADEARAILKRFPEQRSASIPLLHLAWKTYGWLSPEALEEVSRLVGLSPAQVQGIGSFYSMFPPVSRGRYHIEVCDNISCYLNGAQRIGDHLRRKLGIDFDQTTPDGRFTLNRVECIGNCCCAPCMQINGEDYGNLTPQRVDEILDSLEA